jgi:N6-adenosine-specific RNA methylase IME4
VIENFPTKKYSIIYADPSWSYNDKRGGASTKSFGGAESHYGTMLIKNIKQLPVNTIADDNCMLFMWVTFPLLQEGLDTIKAWGFQYKTLGFSWIKTNPKDKKPFFGIGYYTKSNCEVCLIGVKG